MLRRGISMLRMRISKVFRRTSSMRRRTSSMRRRTSSMRRRTSRLCRRTSRLRRGMSRLGRGRYRSRRRSNGYGEGSDTSRRVSSRSCNHAGGSRFGPAPERWNKPNCDTTHFWRPKDRFVEDERVFGQCNGVSAITKKCWAGEMRLNKRPRTVFPLLNPGRAQPA